MGIFDIFKRKQEIKTEKIRLEEIGKYISRIKRENQSEEKNLFDSIKGSLKGLADELSMKSSLLKKINIDERKADPRAKFIIKENLSHYIENLEKLIDELKELNSEDLNSLIKDIDSLFIYFQEKSKLNFEKATFLIGKELGDVKDTIDNFIRNLKRTLNEKRSILHFSEMIKSIEEKIEKLNESKALKKEIEDKINENQVSINSIEKDILKIEVDIEKIKSGESYKKEIEAEADINVKKEELEKDVFKLKEMIDFKKLANIFHYDPKKMATINEYKLNFLRTFERDKLLSIIPLLNEANMADSFISKKANEIIQKEKEIEKIRNNSNKKEYVILSDLNKKLNNLKSDAESLKIENQKEEKRKDKIETGRKDILNEIKQELARMNVELLTE